MKSQLVIYLGHDRSDDVTVCVVITGYLKTLCPPGSTVLFEYNTLKIVLAINKLEAFSKICLCVVLLKILI